MKLQSSSAAVLHPQHALADEPLALQRCASQAAPVLTLATVPQLILLHELLQELPLALGDLHTRWSVSAGYKQFLGSEGSQGPGLWSGKRWPVTKTCSTSTTRPLPGSRRLTLTAK